MFRQRRQFGAITLAVLASFSLLTAYAKEPAMSTVTTLCFGRFLIDLPEVVHIREMGQEYKFMYGTIKSRKFDGGEEGFMMKMREREADAREGNNPDDFSFFEMRNTSFKNTRIFIFNGEAFGRKLFQVEMYHWSDGVLYELAQGPYNGKTILGMVTGLENNLIANLHFRANNEIPSEPGFCIKDGFIADDGGSEHFEEARMQINLQEWPDAWVSFYSQTVPKAGDDTLLQRLDKHPDTPLEKALMKVFRRGKHEVNGFKGEETLELLPTADGIKQHYFYWEAPGAVKDIFVPLLNLEFETAVRPMKGPRPRPSLTDDQAIKLYDTIVNSIRLRPTIAPVKTSAN